MRGHHVIVLNKGCDSPAQSRPKEHINLKTMCAMKKNFISIVAMVAIAATATFTSCVSSLYSSANHYDDLYAIHDVEVIAARQKAEAEVRQAEAEARRAEALALQAEYEAQLAKQNVTLAQNAASVQQAQPAQSVQSDGVIVVEESGNSFVANTYESAYARRLRGFQSASYRMPSSYYSLRYDGRVTYATAYDPAFYNIMVSGDEVWVEPKYITSMFGTWGATRASVVLSPWYYGWGGWASMYDPWYYSRWGFPHYSWWDWNWNICYGPSWGGWGVNLWWGWGGLYRPWYHHHHYGWYGPSYHHHHPGGFWYGDMWGGGGGRWHGGGSYYGSRNDSSRLNGGKGQPARGSSYVNRGSATATPYRSPNSGSTYGNASRSGRYASALEQQRNGSVGRASVTGSRGQATVTPQSPSNGRSSSNERSSTYNSSRSSSSSRNTTSSSSYSNSSSFSSGSRSSSSSGFSGGGYSGGGGGSRSGGASSSGSRGR